MAKRGRPPKQNPLDVKNDIFVKGEAIRNLFDPPISSSTLHRWVEDGKVIKHSHGFYRLNATRKALGLPEEDVTSYRRATRPSRVDLAVLALSFVREEVLMYHNFAADFQEQLYFDEIQFMQEMVTAHGENIESMESAKLAAYINGLREAELRTI